METKRPDTVDSLIRSDGLSSFSTDQKPVQKSYLLLDTRLKENYDKCRIVGGTNCCIWRSHPE